MTQGKNLVRDAREVVQLHFLFALGVVFRAAEMAHDAAEIALVDDVHFQFQRPDTKMGANVSAPNGVQSIIKRDVFGIKIQYCIEDLSSAWVAKKDPGENSAYFSNNGFYNAVKFMGFFQLLHQTGDG